MLCVSEIAREKLLCRALRAAMIGAAVATPLAAILASTPSTAQTADAQRDYTIAAGPLEAAIAQFSAAAGVTVSFTPELASGRTTNGLNGRYSVEQGLAALLAGTGLQAHSSGSGGFVLKPAPQGGAAVLPKMKVTANSDNDSPWGPVQGYVARRSNTGSKTGAEVIETPQSISIVTAQRIEALGATTLKDVLAYTPNVEIAPYGTDSRYDWINIRGFEAYSPGFYQDGLQLRNNGWWAVWQTENYGLERIEIMRGPTSVLYGQNAPGGMVNVISKRPTAERRNEIQVQVGSHSRRQLAGDFAGSLNADASVLYRVVGLQRDAEMPEGGMPDDRTYFAPSLTLQPGADTSLTVLAQLLKTRAGTYVRALPEAGSLIPTGAGTYLPDDVYSSEPDFNHLDQEQRTIGYLLEHAFNDTWTLRQNLRFADLDMEYGQVSSRRFVTVNEDDPTDPANYRSVTRMPQGSDEKVHSLAVDNQMQARLQSGDIEHTVLIGLDYQNSRFDQETWYTGTIAPFDFYNPQYGLPVEKGPIDVDTWTRLVQTGLYLQEQMAWGRWITTLAGRYDKATIHLDDHLSGTDDKQSDEKFSGRVGVVYQHPNGIAPYASYSTSFSPVTTLDPNTGKPFDPETGRQLEVGVRYQPNATATYSAAIFDLRRQNLITYEPVNSLPSQRGEVTVQGLELEAVVSPLNDLNVTAAYTYTPKADVTKSDNPDEIDKQATAVSRHRASLWGDYRFGSGIRIGLGARYVGPTDGINETAAREVPGYTLVDALLGYDFRHWSLALNAHNLTDKEYLTNCGYGSCYFGNERQLLLTANYRW